MNTLKEVNNEQEDEIEFFFEGMTSFWVELLLSLRVWSMTCHQEVFVEFSCLDTVS